MEGYFPLWVNTSQMIFSKFNYQLGSNSWLHSISSRFLTDGVRLQTDSIIRCIAGNSPYKHAIIIGEMIGGVTRNSATNLLDSSDTR